MTLAEEQEQPKQKSAFGTPLIILSFVVAAMVLFDFPRGISPAAAMLAGFILNPVIGFSGRLPLLTIFLASVVLVIATTAIRHYLTDWTKSARMQEAMRAWSGEMREARKSNNTYKLKRLTEAQQDVMQMQSAASLDQMKPMALTMIIVIPIFVWLGQFLGGIATDGHLYFRAPWNPEWDLMENFNWPWGAPGFFPRWLVLYSLFGIPFGQIAQRALRLWEYRRVDLDADGVPAGKNL